MENCKGPVVKSAENAGCQLRKILIMGVQFFTKKIPLLQGIYPGHLRTVENDAVLLKSITFSRDSLQNCKAMTAYSTANSYLIQ